MREGGIERDIDHLLGEPSFPDKRRVTGILFNDNLGAPQQWIIALMAHQRTSAGTPNKLSETANPSRQSVYGTRDGPGAENGTSRGGANRVPLIGQAKTLKIESRFEPSKLRPNTSPLLSV